jgi:hypothetical protein
MENTSSAAEQNTTPDARLTSPRYWRRPYFRQRHPNKAAILVRSAKYKPWSDITAR